MKLEDIVILSKGISELLGSKLDTRLAFKLIRFNKKLTDELISAQQTLQTMKENNKELDPEKIEGLLLSGEKKLLKEEVEMELIKINLDELPSEIEGYILQAIEPIIESEENYEV